MLGFAPIGVSPIGANGIPALTATVSTTLASVSGSSAAAVVISAVGSGQLQPLTGSATGALTITAQGSVTLANLTGSAVGGLIIGAASSGVLDNLTGTATSALIIAASSTTTLDQLSGASTSALTLNAVGNGFLESLSGVATGVVTSVTPAYKVTIVDVEPFVYHITVQSKNYSIGVNNIVYNIDVEPIVAQLIVERLKDSIAVWSNGVVVMRDLGYKSASEIRDIKVVLDNWIKDNNTVSSFTVATSSSLTISNVGLSGTTGLFRMAGGTLNEVCKIVATATMSDGQKFDQEITVRIR